MPIAPRIETPFAIVLEGRRPSPTSCWSNSSITPAPIARRATRTSTGWSRRIQGLRVVYRELPILGPNSVDAARLSLAASKAGRFHQFHDALYAAGRPAPDTNRRGRPRIANIPATPASDAAIEAELKHNFQLAGQLGATGTPLFVVGDRVMNSAVGYDALKKAVEDAQKKS